MRLPKHSDEQLHALVASLQSTASSGLRPRVVRDRATGQIIDGETVLEICRRSGLNPEIVDVDVEDPDETRLRLNFASRHPSSSIRAMTVVHALAPAVRAKAAKRRGKRTDRGSDLTHGPRGRSKEILAEIAAVSPTLAGYALAILDQEELVKDVLSGSIGLEEAYARRSGAEQGAVQLTTERDRRFTCPEIREAVHAAFGGDFIDVATELLPDDTNPMGAPRWYTEDDNGVSKPWEARTWCNPPFSLKADFVETAIREMGEGHASFVVLPDDMSTNVTHVAIRHCTDFLAFLGRPPYAKPDGVVGKSPPFGTLIFGFGVSVRRLTQSLRGAGFSVELLERAEIELLSEDEDAVYQRLAEAQALREQEREVFEAAYDEWQREELAS